MCAADYLEYGTARKKGRVLYLLQNIKFCRSQNLN